MWFRPLDVAVFTIQFALTFLACAALIGQLQSPTAIREHTARDDSERAERSRRKAAFRQAAASDRCAPVVWGTRFRFDSAPPRESALSFCRTYSEETCCDKVRSRSLGGMKRT